MALRRRVPFILWMLGFAVSLAALPSGEKAQRGDVQIHRDGDRCTIRASDGSIIHYQSFDLAPHEQVEFIQPNASSRVLNRIEGALPSQIDGRLTANGQVYLFNPAGVIFGPHSIIDVGRFFAGAARITNEDFLQNRNFFFDVQGEVVNQGLLKGAEIYLIGGRVDNPGRIETSDGLTALLSGGKILIGERGGASFVSIDPEEGGGIGASDLVGLAIRHQGSIVAREVHLEGKNVQVDGEIDVSGVAGGEVRVFGDEVILGTAQIHAKGREEGGTVLVGGGYQGSGSYRQSLLTQMDRAAQIDVSATEKGNGGMAVLWSGGKTSAEGCIAARGGMNGGDGGIIETSAKERLHCSLDFNPDSLAPKGRVGRWVIDPTSITIDTTGSATLADVMCSGPASAFTIANTTINSAASTVILCSSGAITQNPSVAIHMTNAGVGISFQAGTVTTLSANSSIATSNGPISFSDNISGSAVNIDAGVTLNAGTSTTTFTNTGQVTIGSGTSSTVTITNGFDSSSGPSQTNLIGTIQATTSGASMTAGAVSSIGTSGVSVTTSNGDITMGTVTAAVDTSLSSSGGDILLGDVSPTGTHVFTMDSGTTGGISMLSFTGSTGSLVINNTLFANIASNVTCASVALNDTVPSSTIQFSGLVSVSTSFTTAAQNYAVVFNPGGTITPATTFYNTGGVTFGNGGSSSLTFTGGLNTNQTGVIATTFGTVATTGTAMTYGPVVLAGNTTMNTSNGLLTVNGTLTGPYNLTVSTGTTAPLFVGAVSLGDVSTNTSLSINTTGANTVFSNTLTTVGGVTSTNNLTFNNNVSVGGAINAPSLTTSVSPLSSYNIAFLGGGTVTALTNFFNTGTVTFGSSSYPTLAFTNGVNTNVGPSMTSVQGTVNVATSGAPLNFGTTTFNSGSSTLTTNGGVMTLGITTLTGSATLQTGGGNLTTGAVSGAGNFTTSSGSTGTTTITSLSCGTFTPSNSLSVTLAGSATASSIDTTGMGSGQSIVFNGSTSVSSSLTTSSANYSIAFNAGGIITPLTHFMNTGGVTFGNSGSSSILFTNGVNTFFTGVTTHTYGIVQSVSGPMNFGTLNLNGNTTIQVSNQPITFHSTINGNNSLVVNDPGATTTFYQAVGNVIPLNSLSVNAASIQIWANMNATGNTLIFNGPVTLNDSVTLTDAGSGIYFYSTIDGAYSLTLNATPGGSVQVQGAIGSATPLTAFTSSSSGTATFNSISTMGSTGAIGGNVTLSSGGSISCSGTILTSGGGSIGGNGFNGGSVSISSTGGSLKVGSILTSGGSGGGFSGGSAGSITLQPASGYSSGSLGNFPQGRLEIDGFLTALGGTGTSSGTGGAISLSPAGRSTIQSVATIYGNPSGGDLTIQAGSLTIGPNEAVTVIGSANWTIQNTATIGDLIALNEIDITAGNLLLTLHSRGEILNDEGLLYPNQNVHLISRSQSIQAPMGTTGSGPSPQIATINLSENAFRHLLFYQGNVLNFDGDVPVSGIVKWVIWADTTWDTTPLPKEQISWQQILARRLERTLLSMQDFRGHWLWLEEMDEMVNPLEKALADYQAAKGHQAEVFSLMDFAIYLKENQPGNRLARSYISHVQDLMVKENKVVSRKSLSPQAAYYFNEDLLEFTKPVSLTLEQWRYFIQTFGS